MTDNASLAGRIATDDDMAAAAICLAAREGGCVLGATPIVGGGVTIARG